MHRSILLLGNILYKIEKLLKVSVQILEFLVQLLIQSRANFRKTKSTVNKIGICISCCHDWKVSHIGRIIRNVCINEHVTKTDKSQIGVILNFRYHEINVNREKKINNNFFSLN